MLSNLGSFLPTSKDLPQVYSRGVSTTPSPHQGFSDLPFQFWYFTQLVTPCECLWFKLRSKFTTFTHCIKISLQINCEILLHFVKICLKLYTGIKLIILSPSEKCWWQRTGKHVWVCYSEAADQSHWLQHQMAKKKQWVQLSHSIPRHKIRSYYE